MADAEVEAPWTLGRRRLLVYAGATAAIAAGLRWRGQRAGAPWAAGAANRESSLFHLYRAERWLPGFDPTSWRLQVDGLVTRPLNLSWADLAAWPRAHQVSDFHCVSGWRVHGVHWEGWRLQPLLAMAQPLADARFVTFEAAGGVYTDSLALGDLTLPTVLLADSLGGAPLIPEQGSPLRVVIPGMYGYKGVKWVRRITFTSAQASGYWEDRGYPADGVSPPPTNFVSNLLRSNVDPPGSIR